MFCSIFIKLVFLNTALVGILTFFMRCENMAQLLAPNWTPLASFMCVRCLRKEKFRLAVHCPSRQSQLVFAIPRLTSPPPDLPQLLLTTGKIELNYLSLKFVQHAVYLALLGNRNVNKLHLISNKVGGIYGASLNLCGSC